MSRALFHAVQIGAGSVYRLNTRTEKLRKKRREKEQFFAIIVNLNDKSCITTKRYFHGVIMKKHLRNSWTSAVVP